MRGLLFIKLPLKRLIPIALALACAEAPGVPTASALPDTNGTSHSLDLSQEFWIWPGAPIKKYDSPDRTLYVLQGMLALRKGQHFLIHQGSRPRNLKAHLVLVYRVRARPAAKEFAGLIRKNIQANERAGNQVVGVQLDYDSPSGRLAEYAEYLSSLKALLRPGTQLGITGLVDWLRHAPPADLKRLASSVDHIAFQLYTHGKTFPDFAQRVEDLLRQEFAFKVGVLDDDSAAAVQKSIRKERLLGIIQFRGS